MESAGVALQAISRAEGGDLEAHLADDLATAACGGCDRRLSAQDGPLKERFGAGGGVQDVSQGGVAVGWKFPLWRLWAIARALPLLRGKPLSGADRASEDPHREASWQDGHGGR